MIIQAISKIAIPAFIVGIIIYGLVKKVNVYQSFIDGAKKGIATIIKIMPYMVAILAAVYLFRYAGGMSIMSKIVEYPMSFLGVPKEIIPLALLRPVSGIASTGLLADLFKSYGPDSLIGRTASTMMGSTETIFYTMSIYFGAVGIKKGRYTLVAALAADMAGLLAASWICRLLFAA